MERSSDASRAYRRSLVETLRRDGHLHSPRVAAALLAVPREVFVPDVPLDEVYRPSDAIVIKRLDGVSVSSASAPEVVALMLEQLDPQPGDHVLEIGSGSGYNAALLADMVGESGRVISLDIDEDLVLRARQHLAVAGYASPNVTVVQADGALGYPDDRPYDGIMLTVASSDLAPAWYEQLARPNGRLVMPLALRTLQRCLVFEAARPDGSCLVSRSLRACSFISLRGLLGFAPHPSEQVEGLLSGFMNAWSTSVSASVEELRAGLHLWLVAHDANVITVWAASGIADLFGLSDQAGAHGTIGLLDPDQVNLALLAWSQGLGGELRIVARAGSELVAERLRSLVIEWDRNGRPLDVDAEVRACLKQADADLRKDAVAIEQRWTRFELNWLSRPRS